MTTMTATRPRSSVTGLRKSFGDKVVLDGIDLDRRRGHDLRAARPQRRRQDHHGADPVHADRRRRRRGAGRRSRPGREPDAVRAAIGVTGQFSAVDNLLTGEENLLLMADLHHLGRARGPAARRRAAGAFDLVDAAKKPARDLLRRHAAPARPRDDADRRPAPHLPRRADHRPRPAQPPHHVADHPRPRGRRRHDLPHHAVPGRGRPARRPDRGPRPAAGSSPRAPPTSSSAASPAATSGCSSPTRASSNRRPRSSATASRDDEALTLQVPSDGSAPVAAGAARPARPRGRSRSAACPIHTPDLDDVFFALTGHPGTEKGAQR